MELFTISAPQCRWSFVLWQQNNANANHINILFFVRIVFFFFFFFFFKSNFVLACRVVCCSYQSDRRIWVCISHRSDCRIRVCSGGSRPWAKGGPGFLSLALPAFLPSAVFFSPKWGGARAPLVIPSCDALSFHQGIHGVVWRDQTTAARGTTASVAPVDFIFA